MSATGRKNNNNNQKNTEKRAEKTSQEIVLAATTNYFVKWSARFTWTAIIQGAIVALLTTMLAAFVATTGYPTLLVQAMLSVPQIGFSEITALVGLGVYLVVGVIGSSLTAQFYHHFEIGASKPYNGIVANVLSGMIDVSVGKDSITLKLEGAKKVFALKSEIEIEIPLDNIA